MNTLQEDINLLLSDNDLLKKVKDIAHKNIDKHQSYRESGDLFVARVYCQSFLDALIMEDYVVTIENDKISSGGRINIRLKK